MSFQVFVRPAGAEMMDLVADPENLVRHDPAQAIKFEALKELRSMDDGTLYRGSGFRRVASLQAPLINLLHCLDPEFMKEKKNFYRWMDSGNNRAYCTYDRRNPADRKAQFDRDFGHLFVSGGKDGVLESAESTDPIDDRAVADEPSGHREVAASPGLHDGSEV